MTLGEKLKKSKNQQKLYAGIPRRGSECFAKDLLQF